MDVFMVLLFAFVFSNHRAEGWWWANPTRDCTVSEWANWSMCSKICGQGITHRARYVTQYAKGDGNPCPALKQTTLCMRKPCPVNCVWGSWGSWDTCVPCEGGTRSRSRKVSFPSLYSGKRCEGSNFGIDYQCEPSGKCLFAPNCPPSQNLTKCASGEECVESYLTCNGDADCIDTSDEWNCTSVKPPCSGITYKRIPNIGIVGAGYHIINDASVGHVLDNTRYGGSCETVYLGDFQKRFRKPYNVQSYRSLTKAHTTLRVTAFQNTMSLSETKTKDYEHKVSGGISFSYNEVISLGAKAAKSEETMWKKIIQSSTETDYKYFTLISKVEVGQFRLNRNDLKLSRRFRERVAELPLDYDFARYSTFITDFGTHYYSEGSLGGVFEVVYQYSRSVLSKTTLTDEEQKDCLSTEASAGLYGVTASIANSNCYSAGSVNSDRKNFSSIASKTVSSIRGGSSKAAALLTILGENTNHDKYQQWVDSIKHNPSIIAFKISPISNLVTPDKVKLNTERALAELFEQYNPEHCDHGACKNGGNFVLTDQGRKCVCLCPSNYYGVACISKLEN